MLRMTNFHTYKAAFEYAHVGIAQVRPDKTILDVNPKCTALLGYTREELLAMKVGDLTHPDDLEQTSDSFHKFDSGMAESLSVVKRYKRKDGGFIWASVDGRVVYGESGNPLFYIIVVKDITQSKLAEFEREALLMMNEVRKIAGGIAMEMRDPLKQIFERIDCLKKNCNSVIPVRSQIDSSLWAIEEQAMKIINTINSLEVMWRDTEKKLERAV